MNFENTTKMETALSSTIPINPFPIKDLVINAGKKEYTYNPQENITTFELAILIRMFPFFTIPSYNGYDFEKYILDNNLQRHFNISEIKK